MNLTSPKNVFPLLLIFSFYCEAANYREGKITGGYEAKPHSNPYVVSLQSRFIWIRSRLCMGSILNNRWILSAGHCVTDSWAKWLSMDAIVGAHNIGTFANSQIYPISHRIAHPMYKGDVGPYDIAMLKTYRNIVFSKQVQPISLPTTNPIFKSNERLLITGWGAMQASTFYVVLPKKLQEVEVTYLPFSECYKAVENFLERNEINPLKRKANICTGPISGGTAGCSGDSGGPLVLYVPYIQEETTGSTSIITPVTTNRTSTILDSLSSTISMSSTSVESIVSPTPMTSTTTTENTASIIPVNTEKSSSKPTDGAASQTDSLLLNTTGNTTNLPSTTSDRLSATSEMPVSPTLTPIDRPSLTTVQSNSTIPITTNRAPITATETSTNPTIESTTPGYNYVDVHSMKVHMKPTIVGVLSWGVVPCGDTGAPTVYSNVTNYMDFINIYLNR